MARDRQTPRSFGVIPRTPPGLKRLDPPPTASGPPPPGAHLIRLVDVHRLGAATALTISVAVAVGAPLVGRGDRLWLIFAPLFAVILAFDRRLPFGASQVTRCEVETGRRSLARTVIWAAFAPVFIAVLGIGISIADADRMFVPFVTGFNAGLAFRYWRLSRQLTRVEVELGAQVVGLPGWRPRPLEGPIWAVPGLGAQLP